MVQADFHHKKAMRDDEYYEDLTIKYELRTVL